MTYLSRGLLFAGLALIAGGIGLFCFILFVYPNSSSDAPFTVVPGSEAKAGEKPPEVTVERDGYYRLGIRFRVSSEYYWSIGGDPAYSLTCRASVREVNQGPVVFEHNTPLKDRSITLAQNPDGSFIPSRDGNVEHRLQVFHVYKGERLSAEVAVFHHEPKPDELLKDSDTGTASDVQWFFMQADYDPAARLNFRADGPMYGIEAVGGGLLFLVLGAFAGRYVRRVD